MKNILFFVGTGDVDKLCGVSKSSLHLAQCLDGYHRLSVLLFGKGRVYDAYEKQGFISKTIPFRTSLLSNFRGRSFFQQLKFAASIIRGNLLTFRLLIVQKTDVVYFGTLSAALLGIIPTKLLGVKSILAIRGEPSVSGFWAYLYRWSDVILVLSKEMKEGVVAHPGVEASSISKKIRVISNITPLPEPVAEHPSPGPVNLLYVGYFDERKGQRRFIKQVAHLLAPGTRVTFVGGPAGEASEPYYRECLQKAEAIDTIEWSFEGTVDNVSPYYRRADIVVLCSANEGQPRCVIEAASYGKPVVTYQVTSVIEMVEEQEAGYVVPFGAAASFADKVNELIGNAELRRRMGKNGRAYAERTFSTDHIGVSIRKVIDELT